MRVISKAQLKDRARAFAVFTGIAIGAVSGFELIITGGLDPVTPRIMFSAEAPRAWYDAPKQHERFAYHEAHRPYAPTRFAAPRAPYEIERAEIEPASMREAETKLAGGPGVAPGPAQRSDAEEPSGAALRAEIDRLFQAGEPAQDQHAEAAEAPAEPF